MNKLLHINTHPVTLEALVQQTGSVQFTLNATAYHFRSHTLPDGTQLLEREISPGIWQRQPVGCWQNGRDGKRVQLGALEATVTEHAAIATAAQHSAPLSPRAPMPGLVRQLLVQVGDVVKAGQPIAVMEAMKLQLTLSAGADATVEAHLVTVGEMIVEGAELMRLKAQ